MNIAYFEVVLGMTASLGKGPVLGFRITGYREAIDDMVCSIHEFVTIGPSFESI
jgi:hypothetical protein